MYICIYVYTYTYIYTCMYKNIHVYVSLFHLLIHKGHNAQKVIIFQNCLILLLFILKYIDTHTHIYNNKIFDLQVANCLVE